MKVDELDFKRRYAQLSDEALLSINRGELVEEARRCYDDELEKRGLRAQAEPVEDEIPDDQFVSAMTFFYADEAEIARALLLSSDIICYLENEHTLAKVWPFTVVLGGLRLMVPASLAEDVREILSDVSPESSQAAEDDAKPEAPETTGGFATLLFPNGRNGTRVRVMLAIAIFFAPAVENLWLFYVGP